MKPTRRDLTGCLGYSPLIARVASQQFTCFLSSFIMFIVSEYVCNFCTPLLLHPLGSLLIEKSNGSDFDWFPGHGIFGCAGVSESRMKDKSWPVFFLIINLEHQTFVEFHLRVIIPSRELVKMKGMHKIDGMVSHCHESGPKLHCRATSMSERHSTSKQGANCPNFK